MKTAQRKSKIVGWLLNPSFVLVVYIIFSLAATGSTFFEGKNFWFYKFYNNFIIFRESFHHLIHNIDLYASQIPEHYDFFKYSPTFALLMAPFAVLPELPGLILWNLLNALVLFFAIKSLPIKNNNLKIFILWFVLQELLTTMQNSQSNGIVAALLIWAFNKFENGNIFLAALLIWLCTFVKIYAALAAVLFLFYPGRFKFILYSLLWVIVLTFIPLLVVSFDQLIFLYKSWYATIAKDQAVQYGISFMGLIHTWFHVVFNKNILLLIGLALLFLPLIRIKEYKNLNFRINYFSSLLIWLIIFNQRAESPTYIIAICGVAIWYFNSRRTKTDTWLAVAAFIITSFSTTDLFPSYIYFHLVKPYTLKALPCIIIWMKLTVDLLFNHKELKPEN